MISDITLENQERLCKNTTQIDFLKKWTKPQCSDNSNKHQKTDKSTDHIDVRTCERFAYD